MLCLPFFVVTVTQPSLLGESVLATASVPSLPKELGSTILMTSVTERSSLVTSFVIGTAITGSTLVFSQFSFVKYMRPLQITSRVTLIPDVTGLYIL